MKVMIADDEDGVRMLVSATLEGDDRCVLLTAEDGEEALRMARAERPRLVFLDVSMPRRDGYEVCRELKEDPATRDIVVVMLTARAQEADRRHAHAMGADDYLTKPFSPMALMQKVEETLAAHPG